jgi:hypothetical protein
MEVVAKARPRMEVLSAMVGQSTCVVARLWKALVVPFVW